MSHEQSRRDLHRESQHPNQAQPSPAHLSTPLGHPIHPTTTTSTYAIPTLDGRTSIRDISAPVASTTPSQAESEEPPTTDQSLRPVSRVVARDRSEIRADLALWATRDPAAYPTSEQAVARQALLADVPSLLAEVERLRSGWETASAAWAEVIQREQRGDNAHFYDLGVVTTELERTEGDLGVAVREANHHRALVAKVAELHQADAVDPDWCASCVTTAWPCPTAAALATGAPA